MTEEGKETSLLMFSLLRDNNRKVYKLSNSRKYMKTQTWKSLHIFDNPEPVSKIKLKDSPSEMPKGIEEIIRKNWDTQLKRKQFANKRTNTEIRPYHLDNSKQPLNASYEKNNPKMWPGPIISFKKIQMNDSGIELLVGQTSFPFIEGLKDKEISKLYDKQGIKKEYPLSICTYALTQDDQLTLTVRGNKTNMYPGRLHGEGGNPPFTNTKIAQHQAEEMEDEILVQPSEYNSNELKFLGIILEMDEFPNTPDLVGWVPVNLEAEEIRERVSKRSLDKRPNDAIGVVFAPSKEGELFDYLVRKTHPIQYSPPAHGGLVLYGHHNFGNDWSKNLLEKLK